jgi:putative DNA primase/helicase
MTDTAGPSDDFLDDAAVKAIAWSHRAQKIERDPALPLASLDPVAEAAKSAGRSIIKATLALQHIPHEAAGLLASEFLEPAHREAWKLILELDNRNELITPVALAMLAAQRGVSSRLPDGGAAGWAEGLAASATVSALSSFAQLVDQVKANAVRNEAKLIGTAMESRANNGVPALEILEDAERDIALAKSKLGNVADPIIAGKNVTLTNVTWLWFGRIPYGKLTLLAGLPGTKKTFLALWVAAQRTRGLPLPGDDLSQPPSNVLFIGDEDDLSDTTMARFLAAGGDKECIFFWDTKDKLRFPSGIKRLREIIIKYKVTFVVVDGMMGYFDRGLNPNSDPDVREVLLPLGLLAAETGSAFLLIRHLNKRSGSSAMMRGSGSIAIVGVARSDLLVGPSEDDPDVTILASVKVSSTKAPPSLRYHLIPVGDVARVEFLDGECTTTADELVADRPPTHPRKSAAAETLIMELLRDGHWHRQREIMDAAANVDISEKTVNRVKSALPIDSKQRSDGWWWQLRQEDKPKALSICPPDHLPKPVHVDSNNNNRLDSHKVTGTQGHRDTPGGHGADSNGDVSKERL